MFWFIVGLAAAALTTFSFLPQIIKIIKTKSAKDISILMLLQFACGISLWIAYGVHLKDPIIIAANCVSLLSLLLILFLYFSYGRRRP